MEMDLGYLGSNSSDPHDHKPSGDAFTSLYPAIVQCFTIILLGYITGRAGWITSTQAKGLNFFTSKFALPSLLFSNMATLDWSQVEWTFLCAIFMSKAILFFVLILITLFIKRRSNIGLAGLLGIFVTQSNDFALGYPIVKALYQDTQPQFLQYIYLIAPISLVILNPIGFVLLEIQTASSSSRNKWRLMLKVVQQICKNPIIVMTAAGVIANFIFNHTLPSIINNLLSTLGQAFSACALFILGLSIVGKIRNTKGTVVMACGLLTFAKLIVFPMITLSATRVLNCGASLNATTDYSMFAFLYGTFPSAPTVFLYATQYSVGADLVSGALVFCTVASAPLMFVSAMMYGMQMYSMDVAVVLKETTRDVGVMSLVFSVSVVVLFVITKRVCKMPHMMVLILSVFQFLISVGCVIYSSNTTPSLSTPITWWEYLVFVCDTVGILGTSTMSTAAAITVHCLSCHSLCRALKYRPWLLLYGVGAPIILTGVVCIVGESLRLTEHDGMIYGNVQTNPDVSHISQKAMRSVIALCLTINILASVLAISIKHRRAHLPQNQQGSTIPRNYSTLVLDPESTVSCNSSTASLVTNESNSTASASKKCYGACYAEERNSSSSVSFDDDKYETSVKIKCDAAINKSAACSENKDSLSAPSIEDLVPFPTQSNTSIQDERMCLLNENCSAEQRRKCKNLLRQYDRAVGYDAAAHDFQTGRLTALLVLLILCQITVVLFHTWQIFLPDFSNTAIYVEMEFVYVVLRTGQALFTFLIFGLDSQLILHPLKRFILRVVRKIRGDRSMLLPPSEETLSICQQFREYHLDNCKNTVEKVCRSRRRQCFTGSALVQWLIHSGLVGDSTEGQIYGDRLLQGGVIKSTSLRRSYVFLDTKRNIYEFSN